MINRSIIYLIENYYKNTLRVFLIFEKRQNKKKWYPSKDHNRKHDFNDETATSDRSSYLSTSDDLSTVFAANMRRYPSSDYPRCPRPERGILRCPLPRNVDDRSLSRASYNAYVLRDNALGVSTLIASCVYF